MKQIETVEGDGYTLRLWSDAMYKVSTIAIKSLLNLVAQRLEIQLEIDARYHSGDRRWQVRFCWQSELSGRHCFEENLDHSQVVCANAMFLERLAFDIGDRIRRLNTPENQTWIITRREERILVRVNQGAERISFYAREVTQEFGFGGRKSLIIGASVPSQRVAIRGDGSIEFGGMLLQGYLLELLGIDDDCHIRFSVNAHQLQSSNDSSDDFRLQFFTSPGTARLASMKQISRMIEQGQIEIPRSGYFDRFLEPRAYLERSIELPGSRRDEEIVTPSTESIVGRWHRYDDIHADGEYEELGLRTCKYNARSRMIRCAVNPCGPCEGCKDYEKI